MDDIYLTKEGYEKIREEYDLLTQKKRHELSRAIGTARELGDLKENAEYHAAKEAQGLNEARIRELGNTLSRAKILDNANIDKDKVLLGAKVKIRVLSDNEIEEYMIVSEAEADFNNNKISAASPLGQGMLGHKVGETLQIKIPNGFMVIEILEINR